MELAILYADVIVAYIPVIRMGTYSHIAITPVLRLMVIVPAYILADIVLISGRIMEMSGLAMAVFFLLTIMFVDVLE